MRKRAICWYAPSLSCWFQTLFVYIVKYLLILLVLTINFYYCCCRYCSINLLASHWITYKFKVQSSNDPKQVRERKREREKRGGPLHIQLCFQLIATSHGKSRVLWPKSNSTYVTFVFVHRRHLLDSSDNINECLLLGNG